MIRSWAHVQVHAMAFYSKRQPSTALFGVWNPFGEEM